MDELAIKKAAPITAPPLLNKLLIFLIVVGINNKSNRPNADMLAL